MDSKEVIGLDGFAIYNGIVNGIHRPHLAINNDEERMRTLYERTVMYGIGVPPEDHDKFNLEIKPPRFIRYGDLVTHAGDRYEVEVLSNGGLHLKLPQDVDHVTGNIDTPLPTDIIQAYYLFIIEMQYYQASLAFNIILTDDNWGKSDIKNYCNRNLLNLKRLAEQLGHYSNYLKRTELNIPSNEAPLYAVTVLKEYLIKSILLIQNMFEPYLRAKPLSEAEIRIRYFGHGAQVNERISPSSQLEKKKQLPPTTWRELFKNPNAADKVKEGLREENYITEGGVWKARPALPMMLALYLVLVDKDYLKEPHYSSTLLSELFNREFNTSYTDRSWRPAELYKHEDLMDSYGLITKYDPEEYKPKP